LIKVLLLTTIVTLLLLADIKIAPPLCSAELLIKVLLNMVIWVFWGTLLMPPPDPAAELLLTILLLRIVVLSK